MSFTTSEVGHLAIAEAASPKNSTHQLRQEFRSKDLPRHCRVIVVRRIFVSILFFGNGENREGEGFGGVVVLNGEFDWNGGVCRDSCLRSFREFLMVSEIEMFFFFFFLETCCMDVSFLSRQTCVKVRGFFDQISKFGGSRQGNQPTTTLEFSTFFF